MVAPFRSHHLLLVLGIHGADLHQNKAAYAEYHGQESAQ